MTYQRITLDRLVMPAKPLRSRIEREAVAALADSIRKLGQLEPILVRPTAENPDRFEIVAGHKRAMALAIAGKPYAEVRISSDHDLSVGVAENTARQQLTPLDEARAYRRLVEDESLAPDEVAARVGQSEAYVLARLRLASIGDEAIALLESGRIGYREAAYLAGLHADVRAKVVGVMGRAPATSKLDLEWCKDQAEDASQDLDRAPFDASDVTLTPPCASCPKNTAVQRDLFGARDAVCLDVPCFVSKSRVTAEAERDRAIADGVSVIDGRDAERVRFSPDYVALSTQCHEYARAHPEALIAGRVPTWADVLATSGHTDVVPVVALVTDSVGVMRVERFLRARDKARVLGNVDTGAQAEAEAGRAIEDPDARAKAEARERRKAEVLTVAHRRIVEAAESATAPDQAVLVLAAKALVQASPSKVTERVALRREWAKRGADYAFQIERALDRDPAAAQGLIFEVVLTRGESDVFAKGDAITLAGDVLALLDLDAIAVRGEVKRELEARDEAEAAQRGQGRVRRRRAKKGETTVEHKPVDGDAFEPVGAEGEQLTLGGEAAGE